MRTLVPTLAAQLADADAVFRSGRIPAARRAWEDLVQRAQERGDRGTECAARAMLARCLLSLQRREEAREELATVGRMADPANVAAHARYRAALARLAIEEGPPDTALRELRQYLSWAEDARDGAAILDACSLLGSAVPLDERADWLERGIEQAQDLGVAQGLGHAYGEWASALDLLGRSEPALEAWQQALRHHQQDGSGRASVAAGWAVGALACRTEDWPLARTSLEEAIVLAERLQDCDDLWALAHADLALVYEAAGDVIEARKLMIRALQRGREQYLGSAWPERWAMIRRDAERLEVG
ncbi:MAG: hypothetical protein KC621_10665 [Myxococcales bacterium]|nr:hypothetical protein [Myxococcales bacterium]